MSVFHEKYQNMEGGHVGVAQKRRNRQIWAPDGINIKKKQKLETTEECGIISAKASGALRGFAGQEERGTDHEETKTERNPLYFMCCIFLCIDESLCKGSGRFAGLAKMLFPESCGRIYCGRYVDKKEGAYCNSEGERVAASASLYRGHLRHSL